MKTSRLCCVLVLGAFAVNGVLAAASGNDLDRSRVRMAESATDKGNALLKKEKYAQAEKEFRKAIEQEPRYPASYLGLGATFVATSRFEEALVSLAEAKDSFLKWKALSDIAGLQNRQYNSSRERAAQDFARQFRDSRSPTPDQTIRQQTAAAATGRLVADRLKPEEMAGIPSQVFYLEGLSLVRLGRRDEGVLALEDCLILEPEHSLAHYNLAVALFTAGDLAASKQHFDRAVANGASPHPQFAADLETALAQSVSEQ